MPARFSAATSRFFSTLGRHRLRTAAIAGFLGILMIAGPTARAAPAARQYPDLRTQPPSDLRFDTVSINGVPTRVLRFSNTVWNAGSGPVHLIAKTDRQAKKSQVSQRIYSN